MTDADDNTLDRRRGSEEEEEEGSGGKEERSGKNYIDYGRNKSN